MLGRGRVELRIGAQEVDELGEGATEVGPAHHLLHLGADARDLGEAHVVDLARGEIGGREAADLLLIVTRTVRHLGGPIVVRARVI